MDTRADSIMDNYAWLCINARIANVLNSHVGETAMKLIQKLV